MKPFLILYMGFGILGLVLNYLSKEYDISFLGMISGYIPTLSEDMALGLLGNAPKFSLSGIISTMDFTGTASITIGTNRPVMCAVCVILGILCLIRGSARTKRRDM